MLHHSSAKARGRDMKNTKIFLASLCFRAEKKDMDKFDMIEAKYKLDPYFFTNKPC